MPRPVTEVERTCVSFRDQSADWSWESVIPLHQGRGERIATTSDIGHWFRNDRDFCKGCGGAGRCGHRPLRRGQEVRYKAGRRAEGSPPYKFDFVRRDGRSRTPPLRITRGAGKAGRCRHRPLRRGYKECGSWQATARDGPTKWIVGADDSVRPVHSFFCLGATHIKKALCYDAGIIAKGFFILDCAYLTSSMMAVSAASPRRTPVRTMRV